MHYPHMDKAVDFPLDADDKKVVADALKDIRGWKECFCLTDTLLTAILQAAEMRLIEIRSREHGTLTDEK